MTSAISKKDARSVGGRPGSGTVDAPGGVASARQSTTDHQKTQVRAVVQSADGRTVGWVTNGVLRKTIEKRHVLRYPSAIAWDTVALQQAEAAGAVVVEVVVKDEGTTYRTELATFREHGFTFNRGFGEQIGLPLRYWDVERSEQPALFTW